MALGRGVVVALGRGVARAAALVAAFQGGSDLTPHLNGFVWSLDFFSCGKPPGYRVEKRTWGERCRGGFFSDNVIFDPFAQGKTEVEGASHLFHATFLKIMRNSNTYRVKNDNMIVGRLAEIPSIRLFISLFFLCHRAFFQPFIVRWLFFIERGDRYGEKPTRDCRIDGCFP